MTQMKVESLTPNQAMSVGPGGVQTIRCTFCNKGFWNYRDLYGHAAAKHNMQKYFKCEICSKEYSYKRTLVDHMNTVHLNQK